MTSTPNMSSELTNLRSGGTNAGIKTPALEWTLQLSHIAHKSKSNLIWGAVNMVALSILSYDLYYTCPDYSAFLYYLEIFAVILLGLNTAYHFLSYLWNTTNVEPIVVSPEQKKLLGVKNLDAFIKVSPKGFNSGVGGSPLSQSSQLSTTPVNLSATSWRSSSMVSPSLSDRSTLSTVASSSWVYQPGSTPGTPRSAQSPSRQQTTPFYSSPSVDFIDDEHSLDQYLHDYEVKEKCASIGETMEQPTNYLSSYWKTSAGRKSELSPVSGRYLYQLATPSPVLPSGGGSIGQREETGSPSAEDVWHRLGVDPQHLTQWTANLRMWLSQTVLERLVREISSVDESFVRHGLPDMQVGAVGLERLRRTARAPQVVANIPTLPLLVPFLEVSANQEYLVGRIKELAKGGAMSEFRWNSGGSLHGKQWEEHLPTDCAIVMHLLATYLDSQLPPLPTIPEGRSFTSQYFIKATEKPPKGKMVPMIQEVQTSPPHYIVLVGDEKFELPKGRNNLFHTVLLFLQLVKTREHGMLGRVNLGRSGVNILWVIDS